MTKAPSPRQELVQRTAEIRMETERMQKILLLLESLGQREEATIKLIVDCLYDVGSVRIINQRVQRRFLNRWLKLIAKAPKPVVRHLAIQWFHKNVPAKITNWLDNKVKFEAPAKKSAQPQKSISAQPSQNTVAVQGVPVQMTLPAAEATPPTPLELKLAEQRLLDQQRVEQEIRQLRAQVKNLTGTLIGTIVLLGGTTLWFAYQPKPQWLPTASSIETIRSNITPSR